LKRYERKQIENRRCASGWVSLCQIFTWKAPPATIIFALMDRPINVLQLCRGQFSHKETL